MQSVGVLIVLLKGHLYNLHAVFVFVHHAVVGVSLGGAVVVPHDAVDLAVLVAHQSRVVVEQDFSVAQIVILAAIGHPGFRRRVVGRLDGDDDHLAV